MLPGLKIEVRVGLLQPRIKDELGGNLLPDSRQEVHWVEFHSFIRPPLPLLLRCVCHARRMTTHLWRGVICSYSELDGSASSGATCVWQTDGRSRSEKPFSP